MLTRPTASPSALNADAESFFASLRQREFSRLDAERHAYLDYTGSALYAERQLHAHAQLLQHGLFGNPHAESAASRASTAAIEEARARVLEWLDAPTDEYEVCFTTNASAAAKLVAESYPFSRESALLLTADNHNSVNGIREFALRCGAQVRYVPLDATLRLVDPREALGTAAAGTKLFAFPAQSNFSGVRHPLSLVLEARAQGWQVLLDAAALLPSAPLSLREVPADFVTLSFYKMFGYPTGVGALIARSESLARLRRPWFAGGTVEYVSVQNQSHQLRAHAAGFEDGTPDFLGIAALGAGFDLLAEVGYGRLTGRVASLTAHLLAGLTALRHGDGSPMVCLYGPTDLTDRGGTVSFNVLASNGRSIPFGIVEARARAAGVSLRGGCFCNPGASEAAFGFEAAATARCFRRAADETFDIDRFTRCLGDGATVGAVRASVGLANNRSDIERAIDVVAATAVAT
jgi:selenocysteine lyase/cysteine desulfurase